MDKLIDSVIDFFCKLINVAFWCLLIYITSIVWNADWNFDKVFNKSLKTQEWLEVERVGGKYSKEFVSEWALSLIKNTEFNIKIRKPLKKENEGKIDLLCTVKTELKKLELVNPEKYDEIIYNFLFELKFIDEDGFVLHTIPSWWVESNYKHEKYETGLRKLWSKNDRGSFYFTALIEGCVSEEIIQKTSKVVYEPSIEIYSKKLKNDYSEYGFIPEEAKDKLIDIDLLKMTGKQPIQNRRTLEEIFGNG